MTNTLLTSALAEREESDNGAEQTEEKCWLNAWAIKGGSFNIVLLTLIWDEGSQVGWFKF